MRLPHSLRRCRGFFLVCSREIGDVRCGVQSGKHVLAMSISGFDP